MIYGYCRISTPKQNIERQARNIKKKYPDALIIKEVFTGTRLQGRAELDKILRQLREGDIIVFDSVSRMSRNAKEGFEMYEKLYSSGVKLVFLKEPHINTEVYKSAVKSSIKLTGTNVDYILEGINKYLLTLAREQIRIAFEQSEKEVQDLQQRTREGIQTARLNGKQIGHIRGEKFVTKKSLDAKEKIKKYNRSFRGTLTNEETWKLIGISKASFYKYKGELLRETGDFNKEMRRTD